MHSSLIGKIEKAKAYAGEPSRFSISDLTVTIHGNNSDHEVSLHNGTWACNCDYFSSNSVCVHTMAIERLLGSMLTPQPAAATP